MATPDQEKILETALEKIFEQLEKKGQLPPGLDKKNIIKEVISSLDQAGVVNQIDLTNPEHQKTLALGVITEALGVMNPSLKDPNKKLFNYADFFKPAGDKDDVKNELKFELTVTLNALNKMYPTPSAKKELDKDIDDLSENLAKKSQQNQSSMLANDKNAIAVSFKVLDDLVSLTLRNQHGGQDTRYPGKEVSNNIGPLMGNMNSVANYSPPTEKSEMGQQKNQELEDPTKQDYTASRGYMLLDEIMAGLSDELEQIGAYKPLSEADSSLKPKGFSTKPPTPFDQ